MISLDAGRPPVVLEHLGTPNERRAQGKRPGKRQHVDAWPAGAGWVLRAAATLSLL